jgi:hypothetical protein
MLLFGSISALIYSTKLANPISSAIGAFIGIFRKTYISDRTGADLLFPAAQLVVGKVVFVFFSVCFK